MRRAADEERKTVLYVSHNMATIRQLCDRCIVMDQGRIVYDGGVEDSIAMYMNLGLEDNAVDIDLTGRSKLKEELRTKMKLHHVTLIDKVLPTYEQGEDMLLRLRFSVLQPVDSVTFRTTIVNDTNTPLGTSWTPATAFDKPGDYEMDVKVPLDYVARGVFYVDICFAMMMFGGGNRTLDSVNKAFKIEVTGRSFWRINTRGYFRLPESSIVRLSSLF